MAIVEEYQTVEIESNFSGWAYKVLDFRILRYYSRQKRRDEKVSSLPEGDVIPDNPSLDAGLKARILRCLRSLCEANRRYARVLNLNYQGYEPAEICTRLNVTRTNFYVLLSRARSMMKECVQTGSVD